jgi:hypothetical protein
VAPPASDHSQRCQPEMPESPSSNTPNSPDSAESQKKKAKAKSPKGAEAGLPRNMSERVERSLKDVARLMKKNPQAPPEARVMAQLEQAKVSALLHLAEAIRESRGADGSPRA